MRRVFLTKSLGCRLNVAEMMEVEDELKKHGWQEGDKPDLVVINSCAVTHKAEKETRQLIRKMRRKHSKAKLVVTGCFVGFDKKTNQAKKLDKYVNKWVLNTDKDKLLEGL